MKTTSLQFNVFDDNTLWNNLKDGDEKSFSMLFERYYTDLVRYGNSLSPFEEKVTIIFNKKTEEIKVFPELYGVEKKRKLIKNKATIYKGLIRLSLFKVKFLIINYALSFNRLGMAKLNNYEQLVNDFRLNTFLIAKIHFYRHKA